MATADATEGGEETGFDSRPVWIAGVVVLSLVPIVRMIWWVHGGTDVQFADYWRFAEATFRPDGWIALRSLTHFQGVQLVAVPQLIYWLNMRLFGGSNITLGYVVVALGLGQVAILWLWISRARVVPRLPRAALAVTATALIFAPHGAWNFLLS